MNCPTCHLEIRGEKKFCGRCGTDLAKTASCSTKKCPRCAHEVSIGKKFCGACGGSIEGDPTLTLVAKASPIETARLARKDPTIGDPPRVTLVSAGAYGASHTAGLDTPSFASRSFSPMLISAVIGPLMLLLATAAWFRLGVELKVTTEPPGTMVAVDGKWIGATDIESGGLSLPHVARGTHVLQMAHFGFATWSRPVSLGWFELSHRVTVRLALPSFPLTVLTTPSSAKVQIDGRDVGVSDESGNLLVPNLPLGQHVVTVIRQGYPSWSRDLRIQSPLTIRADLAAAAATARREVDSRLAHAQGLVQQRQYQIAIAECDAVLRLEPSNEQATTIKSQIQKLIENESAAAAERDISSRLVRAQALYQQRQYQPAITECDAVLRIDPLNKQAATLRSQIQQTMTILGGR